MNCYQEMNPELKLALSEVAALRDEIDRLKVQLAAFESERHECCYARRNKPYWEKEAMSDEEMSEERRHELWVIAMEAPHNEMDALVDACNEIDRLKVQLAEWQITDSPDERIAALEERIALLEEQNKILRESAVYCASCGLMAPNHEDSCGRWPEVVKALERERDVLRAALENIRVTTEDGWTQSKADDALRPEEKPSE